MSQRAQFLEKILRTNKNNREVALLENYRLFLINFAAYLASVLRWMFCEMWEVLWCRTEMGGSETNEELLARWMRPVRWLVNNKTPRGSRDTNTLTDEKWTEYRLTTYENKEFCVLYIVEWTATFRNCGHLYWNEKGKYKRTKIILCRKLILS